MENNNNENQKNKIKYLGNSGVIKSIIFTILATIAMYLLSKYM